MDADQQIISLSIGGNDILFLAILKACVFRPGGPISANCDETLSRSRALTETELPRRLYRTLDAIFSKVPNSYTRTLFAQLYPIFFDTTTDVSRSALASILWR